MSDEGVYIRLGADSSELNAAFKAAETSLKSLSEKIEGTSSTTSGMTAATRRVVEQWDKANVTLRRGGEAFQAIGEALEAGEISARQAARALDEVSAAARKAAGESEGLSLSSSAARRELIVLGHEAAMGNWTRFGPSMMVLAEHMGGVGVGAITMGAGIAAAGLTLYELIARAEQAEQALDKVEAGFVASGRAGAMNRADIEALINVVSRLHDVSEAAAEQVVESFARQRQVGGGAMTYLATHIDRFARLLGVDAPSAAKTLADALAHPDQGIRTLDDSLGGLNAEQVLAVERFMRLGQVANAQQVILDLLDHKLKELGDGGLTEVQRGADGLSAAWNRMLEALGHSETIETARQGLANLFNTARALIGDDGDRIASLKARIENLRGLQGAALTDMARNSFGQQVKEAEAELDHLQQRLQRGAELVRQGSAPPSAAGGGDHQDQVKAVLASTENLRGVETQRRELNEQILALTEAEKTARGSSAREISERLAEAKRQLADLDKPTGGGRAPSQMQQWRSELADQQAASEASKAQMLRDEIAFWESRRGLAKAGTSDAVELERAAAHARIALHREEAADLKAASRTAAEIARADAETDRAIGRSRLEARKEELDAEVAAERMTEEEKVAALKDLTEAAYQEDLRRLQDERQTLADQPKEWDRVNNQIRQLAASHEAEMRRLDLQTEQAQRQAAEKTRQAWETAFSPISRAFSTMISGVLQGTQTISQAFRRAGANMAISFIEAIGKMTVNFLAFEALQSLGWTRMAAAVQTDTTKQIIAVVSGEHAKTIATTTGVETREASEGTRAALATARMASEGSNWAGLEVAKTAATEGGEATRTAATAGAIAEKKAMQATSVMGDAGEAAASVYANVAAIPFVGWILAPIAAGAAFAAVAAFSAEGGWGEVPYDGALTVLHQREMVLPAAIATPLRAALTGTPARSGLPAPSFPSAPSALPPSTSGAAPTDGTAGRPIVVNLSQTVQALDSSGVANLLQRGSVKAGIVRAVQSAIANGASLTPQATRK